MGARSSEYNPERTPKIKGIIAKFFARRIQRDAEERKEAVFPARKIQRLLNEVYPKPTSPIIVSQDQEDVTINFHVKDADRIGIPIFYAVTNDFLSVDNEDPFYDQDQQQGEIILTPKHQQRLISHLEAQMKWRKRSRVLARIFLTGATLIGGYVGKDEGARDYLLHRGERSEVSYNADENMEVSKDTREILFRMYGEPEGLTREYWDGLINDVSKIAQILYAADAQGTQSLDQYLVEKFFPTIDVNTNLMDVDTLMYLTALRISGQNAGNIDLYNRDVSLYKNQMDAAAGLGFLQRDPVLQSQAHDLGTRLILVSSAGAGLRDDLPQERQTNLITAASQMPFVDFSNEEEQIQTMLSLNDQLPMNIYDALRFLVPTAGIDDMEALSVAQGIQRLEQFLPEGKWEKFSQQNTQLVERVQRFLEAEAVLEQRKEQMRSVVGEYLRQYPATVNTFFAKQQESTPAWDAIGYGSTPNYELLTRYTLIWREIEQVSSGTREVRFRTAAQAVRSSLQSQWDAEQEFGVQEGFLSASELLVADNIVDNDHFLPYLFSKAQSDEEQQLLNQLQSSIEAIQTAAEEKKLAMLLVETAREADGRGTNLDFQILTSVGIYKDLLEKVNTSLEDDIPFKTERDAAFSKQVLLLLCREIANRGALTQETNYPVLSGTDSPYNTSEILSAAKKYLQALSTQLQRPLTYEDVFTSLRSGSDYSSSSLYSPEGINNRMLRDRMSAGPREYDSGWRLSVLPTNFWEVTTNSSEREPVITLGETSILSMEIESEDETTFLVYRDSAGQRKTILLPAAHQNLLINWKDQQYGFLSLNRDSGLQVLTPYRRHSSSEAPMGETSQSWQDVLTQAKLQAQEMPEYSENVQQFDTIRLSSSEVAELWNRYYDLEAAQQIVDKTEGGVYEFFTDSPGSTLAEYIGSYVSYLITRGVIPQESQFFGRDLESLNAFLIEMGAQEFVISPVGEKFDIFSPNFDAMWSPGLLFEFGRQGMSHGNSEQAAKAIFEQATYISNFKNSLPPSIAVSVSIASSTTPYYLMSYRLNTTAYEELYEYLASLSIDGTVVARTANGVTQPVLDLRYANAVVGSTDERVQSLVLFSLDRIVRHIQAGELTQEEFIAKIHRAEQGEIKGQVEWGSWEYEETLFNEYLQVLIAQPDTFSAQSLSELFNQTGQELVFASPDNGLLSFDSLEIRGPNIFLSYDNDRTISLEDISDSFQDLYRRQQLFMSSSANRERVEKRELDFIFQQEGGEAIISATLPFLREHPQARFYLVPDYQNNTLSLVAEPEPHVAPVVLADNLQLFPTVRIAWYGNGYHETIFNISEPLTPDTVFQYQGQLDDAIARQLLLVQ